MCCDFYVFKEPMMQYCQAVKLFLMLLLYSSGVHSQEDDPTKKFAQGFARGSIVGILEVAVNQPLGTIKNDLQRGKKPSCNVPHLYRGFCVNAAGMAPATALQMGSFELFKYGLQDDNSQTLPENKKLCAAVGTGAFSSTVISPCELVEVQQQKNKAALGQTMRKIKNEHGMRIFVRGMGSAAFCEIGFTTGYLAAGPFLDQRCIDAGLSEPLAAIASGSCAGFVAAGITHPIDTIKTKLQADLGKEQYKNAWDVYQNNSTRSLYSGFTPRTARIIVATTVMSAVNKKLEKIMENKQ